MYISPNEVLRGMGCSYMVHQDKDGNLVKRKNVAVLSRINSQKELLCSL